MTRTLYLVPNLEVSTETDPELPTFDIIMDDEENWFKEAIKHLEEQE